MAILQADNAVSPDEASSSGVGEDLASATTLYFRWERTQWSVASLDVGRDAPRWRGLLPFAREELLSGLIELEVGEVCVTETLGPLVDHAPSSEDRLYLCTQMADEARHVTFFRTYLADAAGVDFGLATDGPSLEAGAEYRQVFDPELRRSTAAVRQGPGDLDRWYEAVVNYHLLTEGVLAFTVLQSVRHLARRTNLEALSAGLTNVTRDEARHVTFGLWAVRRGVHHGYRDVIADALLAGATLTAQVLVAPSHQLQIPRLSFALSQRVAQITSQWKAAHSRLMRQLTVVGLDDQRPEIQQAWCRGIFRSLDEYHQRWHEPHPVCRVPDALDEILNNQLKGQLT